MQHKLREMRMDKKMSQERMAELLGISRVSYGMKESGKLEFRQDEMFYISKYFGLNMDQIFLPRGHRNGDSSNQEAGD